MNKDQVQGTAKNIAGKVQEEAGKLVGSTTQQLKGLQKQAEVTTEKRTGDLKEIEENAKALATDIIKNR